MLAADGSTSSESLYTPDTTTAPPGVTARPVMLHDPRPESTEVHAYVPSGLNLLTKASWSVAVRMSLPAEGSKSTVSLHSPAR